MQGFLEELGKGFWENKWRMNHNQLITFSMNGIKSLDTAVNQFWPYLNCNIMSQRINKEAEIANEMHLLEIK